jgi:transcriptional regulator with XRE-family HTH domain
LLEGVQSLKEERMENFRLNLRRLLFFHHATAREAARALDVSEHAVSAWLRGKRRPNLDALVKIAETYDIDSRVLMGDPLEFARHLGERERILTAERNLGDIGAYVETIVIEPVPIEDYRDRERREGVGETFNRAEEPAKKGDS